MVMVSAQTGEAIASRLGEFVPPERATMKLLVTSESSGLPAISVEEVVSLIVYRSPSVSSVAGANINTSRSIQKTPVTGGPEGDSRRKPPAMSDSRIIGAEKAIVTRVDGSTSAESAAGKISRTRGPDANLVTRIKAVATAPSGCVTRATTGVTGAEVEKRTVAANEVPLTVATTPFTSTVDPGAALNAPRTSNVVSVELRKC